MLVDVDSWSVEYEACDRLNRTLISQLGQREKTERLSPERNRLTAAIKVGLNQFGTELRQLNFKLDSAIKTQTITFEEVERRKSQINTLQLELQKLQAKYTNLLEPQQSLLLDGQSTSTNGQQPDQNVKATIPVDIEALKKSQIDILEEQNRGLDTLSQTISRQRALATRLGREVEDQNEILDNLANTMERVDTGVNIETTNIGLINRQDSTWGYWVVILILLVVIIIVLLV